MNLTHLSDQVLLSETEKLVKEEREKLTKILHHLREIERRRLFSTLKFGSLYEYAMKKLGYSEDQAHRRIAAMRLLKEIPEIEDKINSGGLNLTLMGIAQGYFTREQKNSPPMSKSKKIEILEKFENKTTRDAEKVVFAMSPEMKVATPDKVRAVSATQVEIKFVANQAMAKKIQKLKGLLAHSNPNMSLEELFNKLCDLGIEQLEKRHIKTAAPREATASKAATYREVRRRAGQKCENCKGVYALEIDHRKPKALGGDSSFSNLRLLCRSCNQRAAIEQLGFKKMQKYLERPRVLS